MRALRLMIGLLLISGLARADGTPIPGWPAWSSHLQHVTVPNGAAVAASDATAADSGPATPSAARVMAVLQQVAHTMVSSRYAHRTRVDPRAGRYDFDCSGMVGWVLAQTAPTAFRGTGHVRPLAAEFASAIAHAPERGARDGWQRVERLELARPGDVLAYGNPAWYPSGDSGHVAFIAEPPRPVAGLPGYFQVRIVDSNVEGYDDDTRPVGTSGFGSGIWWVRTDPATGEANGYVLGSGTDRWVFPVRMRVGRPRS